MGLFFIPCPKKKGVNMVKINAKYKEMMDSQKWNRKFHDLMGANVVFKGFDVSLLDNTISVTPGECMILGAGIEETSDTQQIAMPQSLVGLNMKVLIKYFHKRSQIEYIVVGEDHEVQEDELILATIKNNEVTNVDKMPTLKELSESNGGGVISKATIEERNAIPDNKRYEGLICYVTYEQMNYQLIGGLTNSHWEKLSGGGGSTLVGTLVSDYPYSTEGFAKAEVIPVATGEILKVPYSFRSPVPGEGTVYCYFDSNLMLTKTIKQGFNEIVFDKPLEKRPLPYEMKLVVEDRAGQLTNEIYLKFKVGALEITCNYKDDEEYYVNHYHRIPYTVDSVDDNPIVVQKFLNGNLKGEERITDKTKIYHFDIGYLNPGQYEVSMTIRSGDVMGNTVVKHILVASSDKPSIYTTMQQHIEISSDKAIVIPYRTSMAGKKQLHVRYYENGVLVSRGNVDTGASEWIVGYKPVSPTPYTFKMTVETVPVGDMEQGEILGTDCVEVSVTVVAGEYQKQNHVEEGLISYFTAEGKSNTSLGREVWQNRIPDSPDITVHGANYTNNNGWINSEKDGSYLRLTGESYAMLDYKPFEKDYNGMQGGTAGTPIDGWTFDILLRSNNVGNEEGRAVSCMNPNSPYQGFYMDTKYAYFGSRLESMKTNVECDAWTRVTYVIDRHATKENTGILFIYINGVLSRIKNLQGITSESFQSDEVIYFNCEKNAYGNLTNFGAVDIKTIRIYNRALSGKEVVQNYIADIEDVREQQQAVEANSSLSKIPVMKFFREYKNGKPVHEFGEAKQKNKIPVRVEYDGALGVFGKSFQIDEFTSELSYQGTSSLQYAKKNYKIRLKKTNQETGKVEKYKFSPFPVGSENLPEGCKPWLEEDKFTIKANYMESSQAANAGTARLVHDLYRSGLQGFEPRLVPPQKEDSGIENYQYIRSAVDGFPIRIEVDGIDEGVHIFLLDKDAKNNFGLDNKVFPFVQSFEMASNSDLGAAAFRDDRLEAVQLAFHPRLVPKQQKNDRDEIIEYSKDDQAAFEDKWWNARTNDVANTFIPELAEKATPYHLLRLLRWVKRIGEKYEAAVENKNIAETQAALKEFKDAIDAGKYFDKGYLIDYFVQVITLGMVDNLGKNVFLTTWDGEVWYPTFYDMDTMLGIDNTGAMTKDVDIEMDSVDAQGKLQFNTSKSLLWILVKNAFDTEIKERYAELRDCEFYTYDNILKYYEKYFIDKIPKSAYNNDAVTRYINIDASDRAQYMFVCNGDRRGHLRRWIKDRLVFMDSLMGYTKEFFAKTAGMRMNKAGETTIRIKTFTPQYVSVEFQKGVIVRKKVGPDKFTEFTGMVTTSTDQEIFISNAAFLKEIDNIRALNVSRLYLESAVRLTKLDCSSASSLQDLVLDNNPYLRELNCSACSILGTGTKGGALNLSKCLNLMKVNCSNTQITSLLLPTDGGAITSVNAQNCSKLGTFSVANQVNLKELNLNGCDNMAAFSMEKCNGMSEIMLPKSTLESFSVSECTGLQTLNLKGSSQLRRLHIYNCKALTSVTLADLARNDADKITEIDLSTIPNLEYLKISNAAYTEGLRLPISTSKLRTLILNNCGIKKLNYGDTSKANDDFNMEKLTVLRELNLNDCTAMESISRINYTKDNPGNIFARCRRLARISGVLTFSGSINSLFMNCESLTELPVMNFKEVTSANGAFEYNHKMPPSLISEVLDSFRRSNGNLTDTAKVRSLANLFIHQSAPSATAESQAIELPKGLLAPSKFPELTDVSYMFYSNNKIKGTIPSELFGQSNDNSRITNTSGMFWGSSYITGIGPNLLKPLKALTSTYAMFMNEGRIASAIPRDFFINNTQLTDISRMFYDCNNLSGAIQADWFNANTKLQNAELAFYSCDKLGNGQPLPDNLFANNKELERIDGVFAHCVNIVGEIPANVFNGKQAINAANKMKLKYARAAFCGCTKITGNAPLELFDNCPELLDIGKYSWAAHSSYYSLQGGIFSKTGFNTAIKVDDQGNSIFRNNAKLKTANAVFKECASMVGTIPADLFKANTELDDISEFFKDCVALVGTIPENLINRNTKLTKVSSLLSGCTPIRGSIPETFFRDLILLKDASSVFKNLPNVGPNIPTDIFRGLEALKDVSSMFENDKALTSVIPNPVYEPDAKGVLQLKKKGLFEDCPNLENVNNLFKQCTKITGVIPKYIFRANPLLKYAAGTFYNCNKINDGIPAELFKTNQQLLDISEIFYHCNNISGHIPKGLFENCYSLQKVNRAFAWMRKLVKSPNKEELFCVPEDLFANCSSLIEAQGVFEHCSQLTGNVPPALFDGKTRLTNLKRAFCFTDVGGPVYTTFIGNCNALQTVECLFDTTKITEIKYNPASGEYFFTKSMTALNNAKTCFRNCTELTGRVPMFEHHASTVKTGCYKGCTGVTDHSTFSDDWKVDPDLYHDSTYHTDPFKNTVSYPDEYEADSVSTLEEI